MSPALAQMLLTAAALLLISVPVVGGLATIAVQARTSARMRARLGGAEGRGSSRPLLQPGRAFGWVLKLGQYSAVRDPAQVSVLRAKLMQAGFVGREAVPIYLGAKTACLAGAAFAAITTLPFMLREMGGLTASMMAAGVSLVAIMGPDQFLKMRTSARQQEYRDGFPDLLDLLVASVEAGLSLDAAVTRVADELVRRYPNLALHLQVLTRELRAGRSRKDAWASLADRLGIDEAKGLATMLRQSEEMGTSLGETLAVFSDDMRSKRMLRAEEKAMALPAKLTLPLILFIFPCLLGVLILPACIRLQQQFIGQ